MAFAEMAARLAASRLGKAATWTSRLGGASVAVRVVPFQPEAGWGPGEAPTAAGIATSVMMTAEAILGRPERDDLLTIDGTGYRVAEVMQSARGVSFTLHLRRA